jgi:fructose-specific component phosphotransferase system IIB-like protein
VVSDEEYILYPGPPPPPPADDEEEDEDIIYPGPPPPPPVNLEGEAFYEELKRKTAAKNQANRDDDSDDSYDSDISGDTLISFTEEESQYTTEKVLSNVRQNVNADQRPTGTVTHTALPPRSDEGKHSDDDDYEIAATTVVSTAIDTSVGNVSTVSGPLVVKGAQYKRAVAMIRNTIDVGADTKVKNATTYVITEKLTGKSTMINDAKQIPADMKKDMVLNKFSFNDFGDTVENDDYIFTIIPRIFIGKIYEAVVDPEGWMKNVFNNPKPKFSPARTRSRTANVTSSSRPLM